MLLLSFWKTNFQRELFFSFFEKKGGYILISGKCFNGKQCLECVHKNFKMYVVNLMFQTIRYVNILLAKQPELADYLVSIIPKPGDVSVKNKKGSKTEAANVPFSHAEELLKHSLHIIGSKGKGFDPRLPSDNSSRYTRTHTHDRRRYH